MLEGCRVKKGFNAKRAIFEALNKPLVSCMGFDCFKTPTNQETRDLVKVHYRGGIRGEEPGRHPA